jgi:hypothetical protein
MKLPLPKPTAILLASLLPVWLMACAPVAPPLGGNSDGAYVRTDRDSWKAWHNVMPGPGGNSLHVTGTVTVSAANYAARLVRRPATPESLVFEVRTSRTGDFGAQVLTQRKIDFSAPFNGRHERVTVRFPDGQSIRLPIRRVH